MTLLIAAIVATILWMLLDCVAVEDVLSPRLVSPQTALGVATGDDSPVFVFQAVGGGSGLLLSYLAVWYFGRRTPVKVAKRLVKFIGKAVQPEHREGVRQEVCDWHHKRNRPCTCDPAEHWIHREVQRGKKGEAK